MVGKFLVRGKEGIYFGIPLSLFYTMLPGSMNAAGRGQPHGRGMVGYGGVDPVTQ